MRTWIVKFLVRLLRAHPDVVSVELILSSDLTQMERTMSQ